MTRGFLFLRHKVIIVLLLIFMAIAGLSGCGSPTQSEVLIPIVLCTPNSPIINVYRVPPRPWAATIFEHAFPPSIPTPIPPNPPIQYDEQKVLEARYAALQQLEYEVKRWSDTETITLNDLSETRVTITYISPELLQAVFLNEVLKNHFPTYGFQDQIQKVLNTIAMRDELLFLLTITTTNNNLNPSHHTIKIPIAEMVMRNAENMTIIHSHDDHNLEQLINTSSGPVFGYISYPLSQVGSDQCKWVLDPKYNTNIVITVPSIEMDGNDGDEVPFFWSIPYVPLMNLDMLPSMPNFNISPGFDVNLMAPLTTPPSDITQANYWQEFARYIWNQITLRNY